VAAAIAATSDKGEGGAIMSGEEAHTTIGDTEREAQVQAFLAAYLAELDVNASLRGFKPADLRAGRAILAADPETQLAVLRSTIGQVLQLQRWDYPRHTLLAQLVKRNLPYTLDDIRLIARALVAEGPYYLPVQGLLRGLARPLADPAMLAAARPDLEKLRGAASVSRYQFGDKRKFLRLLDEILGGPQNMLGVDIRSDEWGDQVLPLLDQLDEATRGRWTALLARCATGSGSAPSARWVAEAIRLRTELGAATFAPLATEWLGAFRRSGNKPPEHDPRTYQRTSQGCLLDEANADLLRGLAWCCAGVEDAGLAAALADAAIAGYRKITGVGPRSAKVAGACTYALKQMPGLHGAAQLERVRLNVKQPTYVKGIEKALDEAARRAGMTREELEELTVPTFGLEDGRLRLPIGPAMAELEVVGADVALRWYGADGKPRKAEPAEVKREHKAELKDLKRLRDDLARMLVAQRDRLERLPLAQRQWSLATWRERYLDHPLVGGLARRLIWRFSWQSAPGDDGGERVADGIWHDGMLAGSDDRPLDAPETATVTPWHPVYADAGDVLAWREWLERHRVTQPFKQAHREIYLLTDAERRTRVYSNRFAAHILRQHQFNALCAARGWRNTLRLMVDDEYPPATLELPQWGQRAEFWVEGAGDEYDVDTNDTGTYLHVVTDQVRFYPLAAGQHSAHASGGGYHAAHAWRQLDTAADAHERNAPLQLDAVPPLVFSEVMRDVDLFVGVASVGNDPTWQDGGPQGRYLDYWQSYSFGELSATAQTRKQLLERLAPRLAIAERCTISGRFLQVRGDLRTYKIHLGSGNILMEPNDQYLCIVPSRGGSAGESVTGQLFLPFEGDTVLAIILSKAFLLAEDKKITDPTITRQIGRG
jgi:hypothetical protein